MNCQTCITALETGNFWARRSARRHLRACADCRRHLQEVESAERQLATATSISAAQRQAWLAVSDRQPIGARPARVILRAEALAACAALLIVGLLWLLWPGERDDNMARHDARPAVEATDDDELLIASTAEVRDGLLRLESQLEVLSRQVELLDEGRQVRELLDLSDASRPDFELKTPSFQEQQR